MIVLKTFPLLNIISQVKLVANFHLQILTLQYKIKYILLSVSPSLDDAHSIKYSEHDGNLLNMRGNFTLNLNRTLCIENIVCVNPTGLKEYSI